MPRSAPKKQDLIRVGIQSKNPIASATVASNRLAEFFYYLGFQIKAKASDQEVIQQLGIAKEQLNDLLAGLKDAFGITREKNENLSSFFNRVANLFQEELPIIAEEIGEKIDQASVPENLKAMVSAMENQEAVVNSIKERAQRLVSGYQLSETETRRFINLWLEQQASKIQEMIQQEQKVLVSPRIANQLSISSITDRRIFGKQLSQLGLPKPEEAGRVVIKTLNIETPKHIAYAAIRVVIERDPAIPKEAASAVTSVFDELRKHSPTTPVINLVEYAEQAFVQQVKQVKEILATQGVSELPETEIQRLTASVIAGNGEPLLQVISQKKAVPPEEKETIIREADQAKAAPLAIKIIALTPKLAGFEQQRNAANSTAIKKVSSELTKYGFRGKQARVTAQETIKREQGNFQKILTDQGVIIPKEHIEFLVAAAIAGNRQFLLQAITQEVFTKEQRNNLIIETLKTNPGFLAARTAVASKISPTLSQFLETELSEIEKITLAEQVATVIIGSQEDPATLAINRTAPEVALVLAANKVKLKKGLPMSLLTRDLPKVVLPPSGVADIEAGYSILDKIAGRIEEKPNTTFSLRAILQLEIGKSLERYLGLKGLDLTQEPIKRGIHAVSFLFSQPESFASRISLNTSFPTAEGVRPSPIEQLIIPENPIELIYQLNPINEPAVGLELAIKAFLIQPDDLEQVRNNLGVFIEHIGSETVSQDPLLANLQSHYQILDAVYQSPIYQVTSPIIGWISDKFKGRLFQKIAETSFGQAIKGFGEKIVQWGVKQAAERIAVEGGKQAVQAVASQGITAALATALGIPTGGASLLIWVGLEALKLGLKIIKNLVEKTGIPKAIRDMGDTFTFGLSKEIRGLLDQIPIVGRFLSNSFSNLVSGLTMIAIPVGAPILLAILIVFGLLTFTATQRKHKGSVLVIGGRGGQPDYAGFPSEIIEEPIDDRSCQDLSDNARKACLVILIAQNCVPNAVFNSSIAVARLRECINGPAGAQLRSEYSASEIEYLLNMFDYSVTTFNYLQCVGFKRAVEPRLPDAGNARDFADATRIAPCRLIDASEVQPGDNAVWTHLPYGHIAIVLRVEGGMVTVAQGWGLTGRVSATSVPIVSVQQFISCQ